MRFSITGGKNPSQEERPMSDFERKRPHRDLQILRRKHEESSTMLAIMMAGIAALFIVGIVVAYNYASGTNPVQPPATASAPPATTTGSGVKAPAQPAESTGAGSAERGAPAKKPQ
jgi:hypothetical protein